jgi:hypothetical protein
MQMNLEVPVGGEQQSRHAAMGRVPQRDGCPNSQQRNAKTVPGMVHERAATATTEFVVLVMVALLFRRYDAAFGSFYSVDAFCWLTSVSYYHGYKYMSSMHSVLSPHFEPKFK